MRRHVAKHRLDDLDSEPTISSTQVAVLARAFEVAATAGLVVEHRTRTGQKPTALR